MPISNGKFTPAGLRTVEDLFPNPESGRISRILDRVPDRTVVDGERSLTLFEVGTLYVKDKAQVTVHSDSNTIVYACDNARVHIYGEGSVIAMDSASVTAFDRVEVALHDTSTGIFHHRSRGTVKDAASAQFFDLSTGTGHGAVKDIDIFDSATFAAYDMTMVNVHLPSSGGVTGRSSTTITVVDDPGPTFRTGLTIDAVDTAHVRVHRRHQAEVDGKPKPLPFLLRTTGFARLSFYDTGAADPLQNVTLDFTPGHEAAEYQLGGSVVADWEETVDLSQTTTAPRHAQSVPNPDHSPTTVAQPDPIPVSVQNQAHHALTSPEQSIFGPDWRTINGTEPVPPEPDHESVFGSDWKPILTP
ncbi:MAG: hypothetical protein ACJA07_001478 [Rhodococcus sp. (in: high G+C Gram-positive bacteria)]